MKKGNAIGALVMAAAIAVSVPLGVNRSLSKLREEAQDAYYYDDAGYAIYQGIDARESAAQNLLTVAKRYVEQEPALKPYMEELEYQVKKSENTGYGDFSQEAEINARMGEAAQALYQQLDQIELSDKDEKYPRQLIAQMDSEQDKIERSSYNRDAREFNLKLERFPVNYLRYAAGIDPLAVFDEENGPAETEQ